MGRSGTGKSTVAAVLLGLATPSEGRVVVGDIDLAHCDLRAWRRHASWAPQQPTLVRGTVAENIALGDPEASAERIRQAAVLAGADAFVRDLPAAYRTVVGAGGRLLSSGERRRVALARAFLRDAPFLILDEPTADLDDASAAFVAAALERLRGTHTILLITHRPELAALADRTVVLERGRATASGCREAAAA